MGTQDFLFKVIDAGHEYVIFADGTVEGFGPDAIVFNQFLCHAEAYRARLNDQRTTECPSVVEHRTA
ncbi:MAG: hypothetical protein WB566_09915 [Terriglobales bacterium]